MKLSEKLEKEICQVKNEIAFYIGSGAKETDFRPTHLRFVLAVLLAEQKRNAGCERCNDPKILEIQIETGFEYCPHCGRSLTDGESE